MSSKQRIKSTPPSLRSQHLKPNNDDSEFKTSSPRSPLSPLSPFLNQPSQAQSQRSSASTRQPTNSQFQKPKLFLSLRQDSIHSNQSSRRPSESAIIQTFHSATSPTVMMKQQQMYNESANRRQSNRQSQQLQQQNENLLLYPSVDAVKVARADYSEVLILPTTPSPSLLSHRSVISPSNQLATHRSTHTKPTSPTTTTTGRVKSPSTQLVELKSPQVECRLLATDIVRLGVIGRGQHGSVFKAIYKPSLTRVALKTMNIYDRSTRHQLLHELNAYSKLNNPYLLKFIGAYHDNGIITMASQFCSLGSLLAFIHFNGVIHSPLLLRHIITQIARGLHYLHENHRIHRDVKLDNLMLCADGRVVIGDFGLVTEVSEQDAGTWKGTWSHMDLQRLTSAHYDFKTDVWSLGITLIHLIDGVLPAVCSDYWTLLDALRHGKAPQLQTKVSDEQLILFIDRCLVIDHQQRASAAELLQHPYLTQAAHITAASTLVSTSASVCVANSITSLPDGVEFGSHSPSTCAFMRRLIDEQRQQNATQVSVTSTASAAAALFSRNSKAATLSPIKNFTSPQRHHTHTSITSLSPQQHCHTITDDAADLELIIELLVQQQIQNNNNTVTAAQGTLALSPQTTQSAAKSVLSPLSSSVSVLDELRLTALQQEFQVTQQELTQRFQHKVNQQQQTYKH